MGYVNDYEEAWDLTQETFVAVWQNLASFKNESKISTWIFRIATNNCLRAIEKSKRISTTELPVHLPLLQEVFAISSISIIFISKSNCYTLTETNNELHGEVLIDIPFYKLYSIRAITLGTFFGGILPGAYMLAQNFKELNESRKASITWLCTAAVVLFIIATLFVPALDKIPSVAFSFLFTVLAGSMARKFQRTAIEEHQITGGSLQSPGKIVLICVIGIAIMVLLLSGIYALASLAPDSSN